MWSRKVNWNTGIAAKVETSFQGKMDRFRFWVVNLNVTVLDPGFWLGETDGERNDRLRCDALVQSTRGHIQLDALQSDR